MTRLEAAVLVLLWRAHLAFWTRHGRCSMLWAQCVSLGELADDAQRELRGEHP